MPSIQEIRRALAARPPVTLEAPGCARAAVALVLREAGAGSELLFIERAERSGDPWSGHMAFPGGRVEACDSDVRRAAEREAREELGLRLVPGSCLGQLDDREGDPARRRELVVSAYVYGIEEAAPLVPNREVRDAFWFPLSALLDPGRRVIRPVRGLPFPGIRIGDAARHVVWGLSYSFLESLFLALGRPLPDRRPPEPCELARGSRGARAPDSRGGEG